jgi:hypothetical protein
MSECKQQQINPSIFEIFKQDDVMKMDEIKDLPFLELAHGLNQLSLQKQQQNEELFNYDDNPHIKQLKELALEEIYAFFKTIAYCNFNSYFALEQLIWLIGESKSLHLSFFAINKRKEKGKDEKYDASCICDNPIVREELNQKLKRTPYNPYIYNCRFKSLKKPYLNKCIQFGNLKLLKWVIQKRGLRPTEFSADLCSQHGHLKILEYIYEHFKIKPSCFGIDRTCANGHLDILKYIFETCKVKPKDMCGVDNACINNHPEIVKYLYQTCNVKPTLGGADWVCKNGNVELIKYIHEICGIIPTSQGIDWASQSGHLKIIKYLYEAVHIKLTSTEANRACQYGKFNIVQYMNETCGIKPSEDAFRSVCSNGHLEMMKDYVVHVRLDI